MSDQLFPLTSMPAFWAVIVAIIVVGGALYGWLHRRLGTAQIIGGLAQHASRRPNMKDWTRLLAAAEREGCQDKLQKQIEDINTRFGENTVRCGHLAVFWYMVVGETSWSHQLPSFADKQGFTAWLRHGDHGRSLTPAK